MTKIPSEKKKKKKNKEEIQEYTSKEFLEQTDFANKLSLPEMITIIESGVGRIKRSFTQEVAMYLAVAEGRYSYRLKGKSDSRTEKSKEEMSPLRSSLEEMITQSDQRIAQLQRYFQNTVQDTIPTIHHLKDLKRDVALLLGTVAFAKMSETELSELLVTRHNYEWNRKQQSNFQETYYHYVLQGGDKNQHKTIAEVYNFVRDYDLNPLDKLRHTDMHGPGKYTHFGQVMDILISLQPKTKDEVQASINYIVDVNERCSTYPRFSFFMQNTLLEPRVYMASEMEKIIRTTNNKIFGNKIGTLTKVTEFVFNYFYLKPILSIAVQRETFIKEIVEPIAQFVQENRLQYVTNMNLLGSSFKEGMTEEEFSETQTYSEQKLALYITNIEILKKVELPKHKRYDVKTRKYEKMLKQEFSSLSLEELTNRTIIREQIQTLFQRDYACMLLQASYYNKLIHSRPTKSKKMLEFIAKNMPYREMYQLSYMDEDNTFGDLVSSMITASSQGEIAKITSLCDVIKEGYKNNIEKIGRKTQLIDNYYSIIFLSMQKLAQEGARLLLDKEYISAFLQQWIVNTNCMYKESLSLINSFMDRSYQLLQSLSESTAQEMEQKYELWFSEIMKQKNETELKQQLSLGRMVDNLSERGGSKGKSALCTLKEEQMVFAKMASVYARSLCAVVQTEPMIDHLFLPSLQENRIMLPEFVHCFSQFEEIEPLRTTLRLGP